MTNNIRAQNIRSKIKAALYVILPTLILETIIFVVIFQEPRTLLSVNHMREITNIYTLQNIKDIDIHQSSLTNTVNNVSQLTESINPEIKEKSTIITSKTDEKSTLSETENTDVMHNLVNVASETYATSKTENVADETIATSKTENVVNKTLAPSKTPPTNMIKLEEFKTLSETNNIASSARSINSNCSYESLNKWVHKAWSTTVTNFCNDGHYYKQTK